MCNTGKYSCADCGTTNCNVGDKTYPAFCLTTHMDEKMLDGVMETYNDCLLYTSPSPRDRG